jgi:hypothetical protein
MTDLLAGAPEGWIQNDELSPGVFAWVEKNSRANSPEYMKTLQSIQQFRGNPVLPGQSDPTGAIAWDTRHGNQYVDDQAAMRLAKQQEAEQLLARHYDPALDTGGVYRPIAIDTRMAETHPMPMPISNMIDTAGDVSSRIYQTGKSYAGQLSDELSGLLGQQASE